MALKSDDFRWWYLLEGHLVRLPIRAECGKCIKPDLGRYPRTGIGVDEHERICAGSYLEASRVGRV